MSAKSTTGVAFKLVSHDQKLLGLLHVPEHIAEQLHQNGSASFHITTAVETSSVTDSTGLIEHRVYAGYLAVSYAFSAKDRVMLMGVSIEDLEQEPGFAFSPSLALILAYRAGK